MNEYAHQKRPPPHSPNGAYPSSCPLLPKLKSPNVSMLPSKQRHIAKKEKEREKAENP
jgi:hypothetical protein